jgi:hypothetical protein
VWVHRSAQDIFIACRRAASIGRAGKMAEVYHHSPGSAMQAHACSYSRRCWEGVPLRVAAGRFAVGSLPNPISSALARYRHGHMGRASRQTLSRWQTYRGYIGMMVLGQRQPSSGAQATAEQMAAEQACLVTRRIDW